MKEATIIFPHQLFKNHPAIKEGRPIYLIEEYLFFRQFNFHQKKLMLHRASMKVYEAWLLENGHQVTYVDAMDERADVRLLIASLAKENVSCSHVADVADTWLAQRINSACTQHQIKTEAYVSPNFLNSMASVKAYFDKKKTYFQTAFYIEQRKQRNILLTAAKEPEGGQWSFDADNRLKFPAKEKAPDIKMPAEDDFIKEAAIYISAHFGNNYGDTKNFFYPINKHTAQAWLDDFIKERFAKFGIYEDALVANENFLHHSVISPMLNIGLLNPQEVIDKVMQGAIENNVPLNSLEGFIRQVIGWREFIRIVYEREGSKQRTKNYWGFTRKIPESFWKGTTGIEPIDQTIRKILSIGYCHHIERLMVLGNFMLLCEFDPDEVYRWFMELFIDSYDWVMVPNVYGMTQFADGGLMTTKPYISGSNYLLKMSDYKKGEWCTTWDGLFWRFMHVHRDFFSTNPRLGMLLKMFDKMPEEKQQLHLDNADKFLESLDGK
jgi:deoxyribodipyrimidine photolyase-related protein